MQNPTIPKVDVAVHLKKGDPPDFQHQRKAKKNKTGDEEMSDVNTAATLEPPKQSFKETLIRNQPRDKEIKLGEYDELDLEDDDVIVDLEGSVPSIRFSDA